MGLFKKGGKEGAKPGSKSASGDDATRRAHRVERELREVIATHLIGGFRGELQGLVSVSRVTATKDLRGAYVYISVLGSPGDAEASVESLNENAYDVQNEVGRKLQMKFCPKLKFFLDESMDNVIKVEKILRDISESTKPAAPKSEPDPDSDDSTS
jgi:ribosome-binding factor A